MKQLAKERLAKIRKVYAHGSCPDGTGAAMIVAAAFLELGLKPEFEFVQHRTRRHRELVPEHNALFVDITPDEATWDMWKGHCPVVLDHHEGARHITEGLGGVVGGPEESGATLAWTHVMCPVAPFRAKDWGDFARLCAIRDNWVRSDKLFPEACANAAFLTLFGGVTLVEQVQAGKLDLEGLRFWGRKMYENQQRKARKMAQASRVFIDDVLCGPIRSSFFNCTEKLASDVCDILIEEEGCDVACGFFLMQEEEKENAVFSIRTRRGGPVSGLAVAQEFGGGGHVNSSSFTIRDVSGTPLEALYERIRGAIRTVGVAV